MHEEGQAEHHLLALTGASKLRARQRERRVHGKKTITFFWKKKLNDQIIKKRDSCKSSKGTFCSSLVSDDAYQFYHMGYCLTFNAKSILNQECIR